MILGREKLYFPGQHVAVVFPCTPVPQRGQYRVPVHQDNSSGAVNISCSEGLRNSYISDERDRDSHRESDNAPASLSSSNANW